MTLWALAIESAVPLLFILGVRNLFHWGRIARSIFIVATIVSFVGTLLLVLGNKRNELLLPLFCLAYQVTWYHIFRRFVYGSWSATPAFVMADPRRSAGSSRDRIFGVIFFLSALLIPALVLP
jgi:hypothetical protein